MVKCDYCGKEVSMPFICPYCGGTFCVEHRLPENHNCPNKPKKPPFTTPRKRKKETRIKEEGELYFIKESVDKEKTAEMIEKKETHTRRKLPAIFLVFTIIIACVAIGFYNLGLSQSYQIGYNDGKQKGYNVGYEHGYNDGNITGYRLGFLKGNETGFSEGYIKGFEATGYNIRDPTYQEALNFIASDQTDKNQYSENYTCENFAADFKNNAFKAGYRCGYVIIDFPDAGHAINCFNTTDKGLIFIEPQCDDIVTLKVGQSYSMLNGYEVPTTYNDTIIRYMIVW